MTRVNAVVCIGPDNVIGVKDKLIWKSKKDLEYFKLLTIGNPCIFGSTTYYGLPNRPLKDRLNIVIDHTQESPIKANFEYGSIYTSCKGMTISVNKPELALFASCNFDDVFICGGSSIYKYFFDNDLIDTFYVNYITSPDIEKAIKEANSEDLIKFKINKEDFVHKGYVEQSDYNKIVQKEWCLPENNDKNQIIQFTKWDKIKLA